MLANMIGCGTSDGTAKDIVQHWEAYYKRKGWDKICPFNPTGSIGYMYAIFKDKNCSDPQDREEKYKKALLEYIREYSSLRDVTRE